MQLRDKILSANDRPLKKVHVPEWESDVYVKPLSGQQRSMLVKSVQSGGVLYGMALVMCLCDEAGTLLFSKEDVDALNEKCGMVLERLGEIVVKLNGLDGGSVDDAKKN